MQLQEKTSIIAKELQVQNWQVEATLKLLAEDNTMPFIARYRKEVTGELNEEHIRTIEERSKYLDNLYKRKMEVIANIEEQGKLTEDLKQSILIADKLQMVEDLYLPYKQKKRTRASVAREKGLEPLAQMMLAQDVADGDVDSIAAAYINEELGVTTVNDAVAGAEDIIAEFVAENMKMREAVRRRLWQDADISACFAIEESEEKGREFLQYKEYKERVKNIPAHRVLAVNRGAKKEVLKSKMEAPHEVYVDLLNRIIIERPSIFKTSIERAVADGYKRLLFPSLERELRNEITEKAEKQAIKVFGLNLRQLLLIAPISGQVVMGLDPGFRTGCKLAVVDATGKALTTGVIYVTDEKAQMGARAKVLKYIKDYGVTLISIGNGTASYETESFVAKMIEEENLAVNYLIVNEAGASVYSASKLAGEEFPDLDVSVRGAISIARRVQDPLAELVKIEPKAIGVGQYQHDVNQKELGEKLSSIVESCVNHVGVDLCTASVALLQYVAGIKPLIAKNIIAWREEHGRFNSRKELLKVARLGPAAFTQCAGFLRIGGGKNPLDNTPVHPESYEVAERVLKMLGFVVKDLQNKDKISLIQEKVKNAVPEKIAQELEAGIPTIKDILEALARPGRDPREDMPKPMVRKNITKLSDLEVGSMVRGTVNNVTDFGAFVDIGVKKSGLIHITEMSDKRVAHPLDVIAVGDIVDCMIIAIDEARGRISLSIKAANNLLECAKDAKKVC